MSVTWGYTAGPDGPLHYWQCGQGPDILFIHQSAQCSEEYLALAPLLGSDYRLTALDLPGHGYSADPPREYSVDDYAVATQQLMTELGLSSCAILGHHGGSSVGISIAASDPEKVRGLVLSGTGIRTPEEVQELLATRARLDVPEDIGGDYFAQMWERYRGLFGSHGTQDVRFKVFVSSLRAKLWPYDAHDAILKWDRKGPLSKVRCPVLLIQGELDAFVQRQAQLQEMIPGSQRRVLEDCGAFMYFERPELCASVIRDFVAGL